MVLCETDGAALVAGVVAAVAAGVIAAGVVLAAAAGVVLAVVVAGVVAIVGAGVVAVVAAGLAVVLAAAFVFGEVAGLALADASALAAGDFLSFRVSVDCFFFSAGVVLAAGCSVDVFSSVAVAVGFRVDAFFSIFGGAGDSVAVDSFRAEVSVFGAFVVTGFSALGFFSGGACFLVGACDASGVGS